MKWFARGVKWPLTFLPLAFPQIQARTKTTSDGSQSLSYVAVEILHWRVRDVAYVADFCIVLDCMKGSEIDAGHWV